ncbi:Helix-turn-helix domain-containing protein [Pseudobutyrivibrio sp. JW11]|uniref:helix-turn-helix domain-containing protein n=1 Tax=Pseudobutyrivibrio sp. JW11 TaxID=1855302 RepID=UPI0008E6E35C|nr:helix-turn-helix transcriptional regulator [Pseudobutyrivibrio sp. JW11]SFO18319.1 Helix-turn-helix domain-containing protein [Pseudobutyrivibrio sp. JW11]
MNIDTTTIGGRIKKSRIDAGYTQEKLAELIGLEGGSAISNYENNRRYLYQDLLQKLCAALNVSADYILFGDTPDNADPVTNQASNILFQLKSDEAKSAAVVILKQIEILDK